MEAALLALASHPKGQNRTRAASQIEMCFWTSSLALLH
jgi:hypothetical protein